MDTNYHLADRVDADATDHVPVMHSNNMRAVNPRSVGYADFIGISWHFLCLTVFQLLVVHRASIVLQEQFGTFAHLYAITSVSLAFTLLGLHATLMRYLAIHTALGDHLASLRMLIRCSALRLVLLLITGAGLWIYLHFRAEPLDVTTTNYMCLFLVLQGLFLLQIAALQGLGQYGLLAIASTCLLVGIAVPTPNLASIFLMLSIGYGISILVITVGLFMWMPRAGKSNSQPTGEDISTFNIIRFSGLLSLSGWLVLAFDNSAILILKGSYSAAVYSYLALSFSLVLYPARINALGVALILPQVSAALKTDHISRTRDLFRTWVNLLHLAGLLVVLPIILLIDPLIKTFFSPEFVNAGFYLSLLMLGLLSRMMLPVTFAVIVGAGRPGLSATLSAIKLIFDVGIILLLRGKDPAILILALLGSWLIYGQLNYVLARKELSMPINLDWVLIGLTVLGAITLFTAAAPVVFAVLLAAVVVYAAVFGRRLLAGVV